MKAFADSGRKLVRTKSQRSESARAASKKRWDAERQDKEPDTFIFELVLADDSFYDVGKTERCYYYSAHRIRPLLDAGYVEFDREGKEHAFYYRPTAAGIKWWVEQRAAQYEKRALENPEYYSTDSATLAPLVDGKGIGFPIELYLGWAGGKIVFIAMRDGLLEFVSHRDYCGFPHNSEEYLTASLTKNGLEFFESLPKFVEVWG